LTRATVEINGGLSAGSEGVVWRVRGRPQSDDSRDWDRDSIRERDNE